MWFISWNFLPQKLHFNLYIQNTIKRNTNLNTFITTLILLFHIHNHDQKATKFILFFIKKKRKYISSKIKSKTFFCVWIIIIFFSSIFKISFVLVMIFFLFNNLHEDLHERKLTENFLPKTKFKSFCLS